MLFNWRDYLSLAAIILLVGVIIISLTDAFGLNIHEWRPITVIILLLGVILLGIMGPSAIPMRGPLPSLVSFVSLPAIILGTIGMIFSSQVVFILLCFALIFLWSFVMVYHISLHER